MSWSLASAITSMPCSRQASLVTGPIETARTWSSGRPSRAATKLRTVEAELNATTSAANAQIEIARHVAQRAVERHDLDQRAGGAETVRQRVARILRARDERSDTAQVRAERLDEALADRALGHHVRDDPARRGARRRCRDRSRPRGSRRGRGHLRRGGRAAGVACSARSGRRDRSPTPEAARPRSSRCGSSGTRRRAHRGREDGRRGRSACARARVTATVRPCNGRASAQAMPSRRPATGPTTVTAGASIPPSSATEAISDSGAVIVRCAGSVPDETTAVGVSGSLPAAISAFAIAGSRPTPIRNTSVPPKRASTSQSMSEVSFPGRSWPVTIATCAATPAVGDRDPGVGGRGDRRRDAGHDLERDAGGREGLRLLAAAPEDERVAALEPHHETAREAMLDEAGVDLLLGHGVAASGRFDGVDRAGSRRAPRRAARSPTRRSYTSTSARRSSSRPRTVISPGSPGPAPTR